MFCNMNARINGGTPKILLVNPPYFRLFKSTYATNKYPLSLGYLAGTIKEETDWNVVVYNADFAVRSEPITMSDLSGIGFTNFRRNLQDSLHPVWAQVRSAVTESKPSVVGIYCCAANSTSAIMVAKIAKEVDRQTIVVLGGPHPTSVGEDALHDPNVDLVVKGEGERTVVELLKRIEGNGPLESVKGIIYKMGDQIVETANREPIEDLNSLCFPSRYAREVLRDFEEYPTSAFNAVLATRGCPHNCFFCGSRAVFGRKTRFRSADNVTSEVRYLQRMGIKWVEFLDDTFGVNKSYLRELCTSLIKNCPKILWECETRVDLVDDETVTMMKRAGCREIHIGVESGNNGILKDMRKGITIEEAISAAKIIKKHGIRLRANFVVGFPTDTEQTLKDTLGAMKRINSKLGYSVFTPYPGTEAFDYCKKAGLIRESDDPSMYNHQSPENYFCVNINRQKFREIALEIERYVDGQNAIQDLKHILSISKLDEALSYGAFRNPASFARLIRKVIAELKTLLRGLFS